MHTFLISMNYIIFDMLSLFVHFYYSVGRSVGWSSVGDSYSF